MILRDVSTADGPLFEEWFSEDPTGLKFVESYRHVDPILELVGEHRKFWIAYEDDLPIGFLDLEIEGANGYSSIYIAPDFRRKGLSVKLHATLAKQAKQLGVTELFGHVEQENEASIRALKRAGYSQLPDLDKDGFLVFSLATHDY